MYYEVTSNKIMVKSSDQNALGSTNTINYVNPAKFTEAAMASDTVFYPALISIWGLTNNTFISATYTQVYELDQD